MPLVRLRRAVLRCLALTQLVALPACLQGPALPAPLRSEFSASNFDFMMFPSSSAEADEQDHPFLALAASFDTAGKTLQLDWTFRAPGAEYGSETETIPLAYEPTAMCPESGSGTSFFTAGYVRHLDQVVVQRWTLHDISIGAAAAAVDGASDAEGEAAPQGLAGFRHSTFTRALRSETILSRSDVEPLRAIAFNRYAGELILLEDAAPRTAWCLDPATLGLAPWRDGNGVPVNERSVPALAQTRMLVTTLIAPPNAAPGFLLTGHADPSWKHGPAFQPSLDQVLVFRDADLDGTFEEFGTLLTSAEYTQRGYWDDEIGDYP